MTEDIGITRRSIPDPNHHSSSTSPPFCCVLFSAFAVVWIKDHLPFVVQGGDVHGIVLDIVLQTIGGAVSVHIAFDRANVFFHRGADLAKVIPLHLCFCCGMEFLSMLRIVALYHGTIGMMNNSMLGSIAVYQCAFWRRCIVGEHVGFQILVTTGARSEVFFKSLFDFCIGNVMTFRDLRTTNEVHQMGLAINTVLVGHQPMKLRGCALEALKGAGQPYVQAVAPILSVKQLQGKIDRGEKTEKIIDIHGSIMFRRLKGEAVTFAQACGRSGFVL